MSRRLIRVALVASFLAGGCSGQDRGIASGFSFAHWFKGQLTVLTHNSPSGLSNAYCPNSAGLLPNPNAPAGTFDASNPIQHIIVIMQENHSLDSQLGALTMNDPTRGAPAYSLPTPGQTAGPTTFDGIDSNHLQVNTDDGCQVHQLHLPSTCPATDPAHDWTSMHEDWNYGWNDQFLAVNGNMDIMGYFNGSDLPYYYWLADKFAISDRYFCSVLGPTWPNRSFLYAATSFGIVETGQNISVEETPTIFDYFSDSGKNSFANPIRETLRSNSVAYPTNQPLWKYYSDAGGPSGECSPSVSGDYIQQLYPKKNYPCAGGSDQFVQDLKTGHLAPISFVDSNLGDDISLGSSEHPTSNVQEGQAFSAKVINALLASTGAGGYWWNTALFLTYDENGGFYDHVAPPAACTPDAYAPTGVTSPYGFDNYGFRVPLIVVSPYAKRHYVSHAIYDHTSILRFIETKFNLPALTRRDANAAPLNDLFDFTQTPQAPPGPAPQAQVIPCSKEPSLKIHRSPHCGDSSSISPSTTRSALISGSFGKLEKDS